MDDKSDRRFVHRMFWIVKTKPSNLGYIEVPQILIRAFSHDGGVQRSRASDPIDNWFPMSFCPLTDLNPQIANEMTSL